MSVGRDEVERIAQLARLRLDPSEVERLTEEMNRILAHAMRLRAVTGGEVGDRSDPFDGDPRDGAAKGSGTRASEEIAPDALARSLTVLAPDIRNGFFVVPPPPGVVHDDGAPGHGDGQHVAEGEVGVRRDGMRAAGDGGTRDTNGRE